MKTKTRSLIAGGLLIVLGFGLAVFLAHRSVSSFGLAGFFSRIGSIAEGRSGPAQRNGRISERSGGNPLPGSPEFEEILQGYMRGDRSHEELVKNYIDRNMAQSPLDLSNGVTDTGRRYWRIRDSEAGEIRDLLADIRRKTLARINDNLTEVEPGHARRTLRYRADAAFSDELRDTLHAKLEQIGGSGFADAAVRQLRGSFLGLGERDFTVALDPEPQPPEVRRDFSGNIIAPPAPLPGLSPQRVVISYFDPQGQPIGGESSSSIDYLSKLGLEIADP